MENQGKPLVDIAEPIHELQCRPGKWPGKLVVFHNQSLADHSYRFDQKILGMHGVMQNVEKYCPIKTTGLKWKMYPIESADGNAGEGGGVTLAVVVVMVGVGVVLRAIVGAVAVVGAEIGAVAVAVAVVVVLFVAVAVVVVLFVAVAVVVVVVVVVVGAVVVVIVETRTWMSTPVR